MKKLLKSLCISIICAVCSFTFVACNIGGKSKTTVLTLDDLVLDQTYSVSISNTVNSVAATENADMENKLYFKVLSGSEKEFAVICGDDYTVGSYEKSDNKITAVFELNETERTIEISLDNQKVKVEEKTVGHDNILSDNIVIEKVDDKILEDGSYTLEAMKYGEVIQEDHESGITFVKNGNIYTNDDPTHVDITKTYYLGNQLFYKTYSGVTGEFLSYSDNKIIIEKAADHSEDVSNQISEICGFEVSNLTWILFYEEAWGGENSVYYEIFCTEERLQNSETYQQFKDGVELEQSLYGVYNGQNEYLIYAETSLNLKADGTFDLSIQQATGKQLRKYRSQSGKYFTINEDANVGDVIVIDDQNSYTVTSADIEKLDFNAYIEEINTTGKWHITYYGIVCEFDQTTSLGNVFGVGLMGSSVGITYASSFEFDSEDSFVIYDLYWREKAE